MSSPFVYTYRQFPSEDGHNLEKQLVNMSTQYGVAINSRTIGTFDTNIIANGERWFSSGNTKLRDGQRLVVQVSDSVLAINHGINMINQVTRLYGAFYDGTNWQTLPYVDITAATNQIKISVSSTQIVVTKGAGAPSISSGIVVLEFL